MKKAAMFGLDARIALAIFGALSVISGAALYSAISQAKVVSTVTSLQEVSKAFDQYLLDTGTDIPTFSSYSLYIRELVQDNGLSSEWNGPYIQAESTAETLIKLSTSIDPEMNVQSYTCDNTTGLQYSTSGCPSCTSGDDCFMWLKISGNAISQSFVAKLDEYIDNADGYDSGNFRVNYTTAAASDSIRAFYKLRNRK